MSKDTLGIGCGSGFRGDTEFWVAAAQVSSAAPAPRESASQRATIRPSAWRCWPARWVPALTLGLVVAGCGGSGAGPGSAPPAPAAAGGSEVFALMDPGESSTSLQRYSALDSVDGLAFRALWRQLEPADGRYDWSTLDAAFDAVRAHGKKLTVHVAASDGTGPAWLTAAGMATYSYASPAGSGTDALPWDPVFLDRHARLVAALAEHVRARGDTALLRAVSDGAPVAEMSLRGCNDGQLGSVAYSRNSYLQAWQTSVAAHAAAFPGTPIFVSAPVDVICRPDQDGTAFYKDVMNHARTLPAQFAVFAADLNALGSNRLGTVDAGLLAALPIGLQTLWSVSNDPTLRMAGPLRDAVCKGLQAGARYFEIYKADLDSTDAAVRDAVQQARSGQACSA
jgi:hypothetical protein